MLYNLKMRRSGGIIIYKLTPMNIFRRLLNVIFPENFTCDLCGREVFDGDNLCKTCKSKVELNNGETCPLCGRKTSTSRGLCLECKQLAPKYKRAVSAFVYGGGSALLVQKFKNGNAYLKNYFADALAEKCKIFEGVDGICYVPMTDKAVKKRGYNQAYLLAKELSQRLNIPLLKNAVKKVRETQQQKSLSRQERELNLRACFRADKEQVFGKTLLLVDDVMTTGATADAVCVELLKKGAMCVYFASVASVEYKDPNAGSEV